MKKIFDKRTVLVSGKGGVGKTTVAAAFSRAAAQSGKRVLVTEVAYESDSPTPLADLLGVKRATDDPQRVSENLSMALLTPHAGHLHFLRDALPVRMLADAAMKSAAIRRFLLAAPSLAEMGLLYRMLNLLRRTRSDGSSEFEMLVIDLPATGHALGLAQVPSAILKVITRGPVYEAVKDGLSMMRDPLKTGTLLVTLPETLPTSEAIELARGIATHQVPLAGIVVNRVPHNPFSPAERAVVDALVLDPQRTLGARTLPRLDPARESIARIESELGQVPMVLPEIVDETQVEESMFRAMSALAGAR